MGKGWSFSVVTCALRCSGKEQNTRFMPSSLHYCLFPWIRAVWLIEGRHVMLFNCKFVAEPIEQEVKVSYDWTTEINSYKCNGNTKMKIKQTIIFSDTNCIIIPIFNAGTQFWVSSQKNNWYKIPESSVTISHYCQYFSTRIFGNQLWCCKHAHLKMLSLGSRWNSGSRNWIKTWLECKQRV